MVSLMILIVLVAEEKLANLINCSTKYSSNATRTTYQIEVLSTILLLVFVVECIQYQWSAVLLLLNR